MIHAVRLDDENSVDIAAGYDIVLGAVDNHETRRVLNRACATAGRPSRRFGDGLYGWWPRARYGPCRACLIPEEDDGDRAGPPVLGAVAGMVG